MESPLTETRELPRRIPGAHLDRGRITEYFDQLRVETYLVDATSAAYRYKPVDPSASASLSAATA